MRLGDGSSVARAFCETEELSPCLVPDGLVISLSQLIYLHIVKKDFLFVL